MNKWLIVGIVAGIIIVVSGIGVFIVNTKSTQKQQSITSPQTAVQNEQQATQSTPTAQSSQPTQSSLTQKTNQATPTPTSTNPDEPPLKLKSIGINLDYYDSATGKAGDLVFTKEKLQFNVLFTEFGFTIPGNQSSTGQDKRNPQPTFQAPMGTKVLALVDGVVVNIPKLYSDDYSIMVAKDQSSQFMYETEHVINPLVKVGDTVKAGQVVAEVSPHNSQGNAGYGLVEIGILKGGNPPQHLCPFAYLDDSIKNDVSTKLKAFYASWEEYRSDTTLHDESAQSTPGCLTLDPIDG